MVISDLGHKVFRKIAIFVSSAKNTDLNDIVIWAFPNY